MFIIIISSSIPLQFKDVKYMERLRIGDESFVSVSQTVCLSDANNKSAIVLRSVLAYSVFIADPSKNSFRERF